MRMDIFNGIYCNVSLGMPIFLSKYESLLENQPIALNSDSVFIKWLYWGISIIPEFWIH